MSVPVTALYGALLALYYVFISLNVSRNRGKARIFVQQAKDVPEHLYLAQRAHINAAEYIPIGIALLAVLELAGASSMWLHVLGGTLLVSRILHAIGILNKLGAVQLPGAIFTWLTLVVQAVYLLVLRYG